jgi:class 3 adenylate cyclase
MRPEGALHVVDEPSPRRVFAVVLFTDIADSTAHAVRLGDRAWAALLARHQATVRRRLAEHGGRALDVSGDGFFAVFDVPSDAIDCACRIRADTSGLGLRVRTGIHAGECEQLADTLAGVAVHLGARIAQEAEADEILVSGIVRELVDGSDRRFVPRGSRLLKGIPEPRPVYAVARGAAAARGTC